ncbi:cellulose binding domain-containing protein [Actinoplanes sp. NPDC051470]|uniref:cellulose binding domain-containing protein n=1 Tax=Actinoplanes sp. NPDC051470 TaxID=3157224 RepID=UPI00343B7DAB
MADNTRGQRRTVTVVVLDWLLGLAARVQAGPTPQPRVRTAALSRRSRLWRVLLAAGVAAALGGTAMLITVLVRTPDASPLRPETAAGLPGPPSPPPGTVVAQSPSAPPTRTDSAPSLPPLPSASASASSGKAAVPTFPLPGGGAPSASAGGSAPALTARYATSSLLVGLLGYHMVVTVTNPGAATRNGWTLVVTLPRKSLSVGGVSGASADQDGAAWTFTPDDSTSRIPAGKSVSIAFDVRGATLLNAAPAGCTIDGAPCS